ncbi:MAG: RNA polymerase sigma factor [Planctomycetes bacterium]|nr:RNA polymerase sigma factor [Planctomycetota bacterium]
MSDDREKALFDAFRSRPGKESLLTLLREHQDRIFNICFQVLRHIQDAQDAAQEALLEVTQGIRQIENARAFKTWLCRVTVHTALDHKKARSRHAELLRRKAAMETSKTGTPSEEERSAVIDALAHLDDESRCLVIEHYFDKATLEELGKRHGVSAAAIRKRIERAKEELKRALAGAGFAFGPDQVARTLESVTPVSAPPGLIGEVIASKAALFGAGGGAMATKTTFSVAAFVMVVLCLSVGMVALLVWSATKELRTIPEGRENQRLHAPEVAQIAPPAADPTATTPVESDRNETSNERPSATPNSVVERIQACIASLHEAVKKFLEGGGDLRHILEFDRRFHGVVFFDSVRSPQLENLISELNESSEDVVRGFLTELFRMLGRPESDGKIDWTLAAAEFIVMEHVGRIAHAKGVDGGSFQGELLTMLVSTDPRLRFHAAAALSLLPHRVFAVELERQLFANQQRHVSSKIITAFARCAGIQALEALVSYARTFRHSQFELASVISEIGTAEQSIPAILKISRTVDFGNNWGIFHALMEPISHLNSLQLMEMIEAEKHSLTRQMLLRMWADHGSDRELKDPWLMNLLRVSEDLEEVDIALGGILMRGADHQTLEALSLASSKLTLDRLANAVTSCWRQMKTESRPQLLSWAGAIQPSIRPALIAHLDRFLNMDGVTPSRYRELIDWLAAGHVSSESRATMDRLLEMSR